MLAPAGDAHKGITSKFTYNAEVYPVFLNRCGRCHIDGGVGPMSLLKYEDAFPWAESLRAELLDGDERRPARFRQGRASADLGARARHRARLGDWRHTRRRQGADAADDIAAHRLGAGPPRSDRADAQPVSHERRPLSKPPTSRRCPIPTPTPVTVGRLDLLPGNPAIVRSAVLSLRSPDGTSRVLGTWVPRQVPAPIALKPPVRIDPGSQIVAAHALQENVEARRPADERSVSRRLVRRLTGTRHCAALPFSSPAPGLPASPPRASSTKQGAAVTVIDARDRVGGRVLTMREPFLHGEHAEAGGDLIDESQTEICTLIAAVGLRTARILPGGFTSVRQDGARRRIGGKRGWEDLARRLQPEVRAFCVSEQRWDGGVAESLARRIGRRSGSIASARRKRCKDVAVGMRGFFLADPDELSLLALDRSVRRGRRARQREDVPHHRRQRSPPGRCSQERWDPDCACRRSFAASHRRATA